MAWLKMTNDAKTVVTRNHSWTCPDFISQNLIWFYSANREDSSMEIENYETFGGVKCDCWIWKEMYSEKSYSVGLKSPEPPATSNIY